MDANSVSPRDWLNAAREAFRNGEYQTSLERYQYFFEHALDDDPAAFYGVRLSYCLAEWSRLGRAYPPALEALVQRKAEAIQRLEKTRDPEQFHDFESICGYLDVREEALVQFRRYHQSDPPLARTIIRFVWDKLVDAGDWEMCGAYLGSPDERYTNALGKFDEAMKVCREEPELGGDDFERQIQGWYVRDVGNVIAVSQNTGREAEAHTILARAERDTHARGCPMLVEQIRARVAL
jgi:tetratricopeptide (TPR) repeat protein